MGDKNNTGKLNCEAGKNTDILSSKNDSKIQDKNTENGNVAKTGPEDVGKKTGLAFFMDEVKIGDKNTESGTETKEMDKKSNITSSENEGKKQDINIENRPVTDHFERKITVKNTEVIMETSQIEFEPGIASSMMEGKMHDKNTDECFEESKMKTDTINKIPEVMITKDDGKIKETNSGVMPKDETEKEAKLLNNTKESNIGDQKAEEEMIKYNEKVYSKKNDSSVDKPVMCGNIAEGKNEEIPKEECKNEGVLKPFKIPKKAEFASKGDMKTDKIREEHKLREEPKLKVEHKQKTENVEKKTEFISKGDKLKERMK